MTKIEAIIYVLSVELKFGGIGGGSKFLIKMGFYVAKVFFHGYFFVFMGNFDFY